MKKILITALVALVGLSIMSCRLSFNKSSFAQNQAAKKSTMQTANVTVPVPQITNFLERQNVAKRAKTMDQPDKLFYVYLFNYGGERARCRLSFSKASCPAFVRTLSRKNELCIAG
jgi:hypothetical protein